MQQGSLNLTMQDIRQRVQHCINVASVYFNHSFTMPEVKFNQRGKIAGSARLQKNELRFNPVLMKDNLELFLSDVVPHEVCHLLAFTLYGRVKPHGREWQQLMREVFGRKPQTYHMMDVSKVAGQKFTYLCACGPIQLSIRRHNKVVRKVQQYRCLKCGSQLIAA
ncbi:SprT family zinc-dependent metalloprotease [Paraglaciecola sp.]|uniref:SprT family zinc-dependent metalloprotease n=1 Tax=Paraglaciecola sp. TaxID=1920173 RepID=UPI0030F447BC